MPRVTAIQTTLQVPGQGVTGIQTDIRLPNNRVRTSTSDVKREELKKQLNFIAVCSPNFSLGYKVKNQAKAVDDFKEAFLDVRDLILNQEGKESSLEAINDFTINFDLQVATYTDPATGEETTVDLMNINETLVEEFFNQADELIHFRRNQDLRISQHGKGNLKGEAPLIRNAEATQALSTQFADCAQRNVPRALAQEEYSSIERVSIAKRLLFSEMLDGRFPVKLGELIKKKQKDYDDALKNKADRKLVNQLHSEVEQLRELQKKLKGLDPYALSLVLSMYPVEEPIYPEEVEKRAKEIERGLIHGLKYNDKNKNNSEEQAKMSYIRDLIGMLYINRWEYHSYCQKHNMKMKQEGIADVYLRAAIAYANGEDPKDVSKQIVSTLCEGFSDDLKKEVQTLIDDIEFSNIPDPQVREFDFETKAPIPSGLTQKVKESKLDDWRRMARDEMMKMRHLMWNPPAPAVLPAPTITPTAAPAALPAPTVTPTVTPAPATASAGIATGTWNFFRNLYRSYYPIS